MFRVRLYCDECEPGYCIDEVEDFDTREEAEAWGEQQTDDIPPWYYSIDEVEC